MPSSSLNVPHFHQELDCCCMAACVRMFLAHDSDVRRETDLRTLWDFSSPVPVQGNRFRRWQQPTP